MGLDVLLQVLGTLEGLSAEVALVRLERNVHADVRGDVIALYCCGPARVPLASQVEVVGALPADMALTDVVIKRLSSIEALVALVPTASEVVILGGIAGCSRRGRNGGRQGRSIGAGAGVVVWAR